MYLDGCDATDHSNCCSGDSIETFAVVAGQTGVGVQWWRHQNNIIDYHKSMYLDGCDATDHSNCCFGNNIERPLPW